MHAAAVHERQCVSARGSAALKCNNATERQCMQQQMSCSAHHHAVRYSQETALDAAAMTVPMTKQMLHLEVQAATAAQSQPPPPQQPDPSFTQVRHAYHW